MLVALRRHISEERNKDMVSLMRFLQSSSISRVDDDDELFYSNKSEIGVQSPANTKSSATIKPAVNTSSAELCSIATDDMTLSNEL
jgi:hypothetical protein